MKLKMWQVDAFAAKPLEGNPAALVPLETFLDASLMQKIAGENNLAETAYFVRTGAGKYDLRWFTPESEVDLCGHATLATAWLIFEKLDPQLSSIAFATRSGALIVHRGRDGRHTMSMPSDPISPYAPRDGFAHEVAEALGSAAPAELLKGRYVVGVWPKASDIRGLKGPGEIARVLTSVGAWGFIATAPGDEGYDFISRFFAPGKGVPEDPVTGSAHCALVPYWSKRLGKKTLAARQVSPRGGDLVCTDEGARTVLSGPCALYLTGEIEV